MAQETFPEPKELFAMWRSRLETGLRVQVLTALGVGEGSPSLPMRDVEEILDPQSPDPDAVAPAGGGELCAIWAESHAFDGASGPSQDELLRPSVRVEQ